MAHRDFQIADMQELVMLDVLGALVQQVWPLPYFYQCQINEKLLFVITVQE